MDEGARAAEATVHRDDGDRIGPVPVLGRFATRYDSYITQSVAAHRPRLSDMEKKMNNNTRKRNIVLAGTFTAGGLKVAKKHAASGTLETYMKG